MTPDIYPRLEHNQKAGQLPPGCGLAVTYQLYVGRKWLHGLHGHLQLFCLAQGQGQLRGKAEGDARHPPQNLSSAQCKQLADAEPEEIGTHHHHQCQVWLQPGH